MENFTNSFTRFADPIVAPYWKDLRPEIESHGSIFTRTTSDTSLLNEMAALIESSNPDFTGFQLKQAVVVTFEEMTINFFPEELIRVSVAMHARLFAELPAQW